MAPRITFCVLVMCSFSLAGIAAEKTSDMPKSIDERLTALEKAIHPPNPLAHDIGLRRELEATIQQQKHIDQRIAKIDAGLDKLDEAIKALSPSVSPQQVDSMLDGKISDIRAEILALLELTKKQHGENLSAFIASSDKALTSAAGSADMANKSLENFILFMQVIIGLFALVGSIIGFFVFKALKIARDIEGDILINVGLLKILKDEVRLMHKLIDLKDAFRLFKEQRRDKNAEAGELKPILSAKLTDLLNGYNSIEKAWRIHKNNEDNEESLTEIKDNKSYCYAVKGFLDHIEGDKSRAADAFELAYINNVSGLTNRIYNFGCASAIRYKKTPKPLYIERMVDCYVELTQYKGKRERFVKDEEIVDLKPLLDLELRKRNLASLIV